MPISSSDPQKQHRVKAKPATKKNTKRKSNKKSVGEGNWWNIKDVIDERLEKGVVHYLVEWDGTDPNTGQPYDPGWVSMKRSIAFSDLVAKSMYRNLKTT